MDIKRAPKKKTKQYVIGGIAIAALAIVTFSLSNLEARPPSVERATVWIDSVQRGTMLRQVRAPGTLVPEHIRYIAAVTGGRVEALPIRPGTQVTPSTVIIELSNPDVQLQALDAERALTAAQADLINLKQSLSTSRLAQQATVAQVKTEYGNAKRTLETLLELDKAKKGLASPQEIQAAQEHFDEVKQRVQIEQQKLDEINATLDSRIKLQEDQVKRLTDIEQFQKERVNSMHVLAGEAGLVQQIGDGTRELEMGQYVLAGQTLATIAQPGKLKAVLRVPETQAKDVVVGQKASIDTRNGLIDGHVMRVDPISQNGTVTVEVALDGALPAGARSDLSVDGTIEIERLNNVMYVGRPAYGQAESTVGMFKLEPNGKDAVRVNVKLGKSSVNTIEVISGLNVHDKVIISDMSAWDNANRIRLQ